MGDATRETRADTRSGDPAGACAQRARIAAARIVSSDLEDRSPQQRAAMLTRLGLTRIIWDWREEHALRFAAEMDALEAADISVVGLWCPLPLGEPGAPDADVALGLVDPHVRAQVEQLRRRGSRPDLWTCVEFGQEGTPARLSPAMQRARVRRVADHLEPLARLALDADMCLALTNHLGWFGEPENQVEVVEELAHRDLRNVGIAYQFQHSHHHAHRFAEVLAIMQPHLVAVALSGVDPDGIQTGRKILPWGAGRMDRKLAHVLMASGWEGQIAVQGHSSDDAEPRLLDSLEGIEWMLDRWKGVRHARPVPRIATPAWPEPTSGGPYMGMSLLSRRLRRRLVDSGQVAPTLPRVRTSPPEPPPITLPQRQVAEAVDTRAVDGDEPPEDTNELPTRAAPRRRRSEDAIAGTSGAGTDDGAVADVRGGAVRRSRGGAAGVLAAIHAARAQVDSDGVPEIDAPAAAERASGPAKPRKGRGTGVAAGRRRGDAGPVHPLSPIQDAPPQGTSYEPESAAESGELPLRIARREVTFEAPDPYTGAIHALLTHLGQVGFRGAPRSFGWDAQGRHLVEWVDGVRADHPDAPTAALDPARIGAFMREMHDALATFEPPADAQWFDGLPGPGGDLIIHQDIAPSNMVIAEDGRLVAIDWDAAAPGTRLWDVAHAVHAFAPLHGRGFEISSQAERMRAFADGYQLSDSERERLLPLLALRSERMYHYLAQMRATGESPWLELWERGVGSVWASDAQWIRKHEHEWRAALLG
ncbi:phosphotransferase [Demequina activiva]|uniref:Aminoglycoside phosphotransferase domain-containing protein n=1 Tax=Demequina activiva TaxID=1582364 RepID=A0A919Q0B8_9MICO|nr:phosphotransferase [Demequina activiva]GIG53970.1 hypothetical protein Dac01nite_07220 [Demequina activiva]